MGGNFSHIVFGELGGGQSNPQKSFKEVLNNAVRRGLAGQSSGDSNDFEIRARPLKVRAGLDPARLHHIDDDIEIDEFLRKTQALSGKEP